MNSILLIVSALLLVVVAWNWSLRKMAVQKTVELNKSNALLQEAQSIARIGLFNWVFDEGKVDYSDESLAIYGIDFEKYDGKLETAINMAMHPDDREKVRQTNEFVRTTDEPVPLLDFRVIDDDGTVRHVLARGKRYYDKNGKAVGLLGVVQDITDFRRAEEKLKLTSDLLHNIVNNSKSLIIAKDMDGKYILANRLSEELIDYSEGEMLGKTDEEIFPLEAAEKLKKEDRKVLESGQPFVIEETFLLKGQTHIFHTNKFPLFNEQGNIFALCAMATDITEHKLAQQKLQEYSERLEEMVEKRARELKKTQDELLLKERLAVLGNLSGGISHEIRNPLGAIGSSVYFLKMKLDSADEKIQEHLERIQSNIDKATAIIESLLNLTRMEKPAAKPHDLKHLILEIVADIDIPDEVKIVIMHPETPVVAAVDAAQIRIAVKNLVNNAIQALNSAGTIEMDIRQPDPEWVEIAISDNGPGIEPQHLEHIFQPLFTTKVHGIGFGLSIAKMIVEKHGGKITAESPPGSGATFVISLPQHRVQVAHRQNDH